eukprot:scaffold14717_cov132-Amphora_coffeaeformis.AAC.1
MQQQQQQQKQKQAYVMEYATMVGKPSSVQQRQSKSMMLRLPQGKRAAVSSQPAASAKTAPNTAVAAAVATASPATRTGATAAGGGSAGMTSDDDRSSTASDVGGGSEILVKRRSGESDKAFEKRRTRVYGKRFHAKRKQEISTMQETCDMLRQVNQALVMDNEKLERLLTQAREIVNSLQQVPPPQGSSCV